MNITLAIPVMNQINDTKAAIGTFRHMTSDDAEWMIIDNGSTEDWEGFIRRNIRPKKLQYIRNEENVGMIKTMQQAYENCETEILALTHNDVYVYEKDWDKRVASYFEEIDKLGGVGFFGAQGCGPMGERIQDVPAADIMAGMSNMLEAEVHGMRMTKPWSSAAIFDGFMMIFSMEMLKAGNGFDTRYHYHHIYDRDASLESLRRGYKNIVVDVPCHHVGGTTANRSQYQEWIKGKLDKEQADKWTHDENSKIFADKFKEVLPLYVENDFVYRTGQEGQWIYKGNKIVGYEQTAESPVQKK